jgi:uncharacterized protein YjiS (DUF1127 family)
MSAMTFVTRVDVARLDRRSRGETHAPAFSGPWQIWAARRRQRAELRRLLRTGFHLIDDIGMPLALAIEEAGKPFWRP